MEIDIKKEQARVEAELTQLNQQLAQIDQQLTNWQNQRNNTTVMINKQIGKLELLQGLDKPDERTDNQTKIRKDRAASL